jgi:hypothetical protein
LILLPIFLELRDCLLFLGSVTDPLSNDCELGLRVDGRRANELRKISAKLGVLGQADGSAYLEMGNTKVLAAVYGPHEVRFLLEGVLPVLILSLFLYCHFCLFDHAIVPGTPSETCVNMSLTALISSIEFDPKRCMIVPC